MNEATISNRVLVTHNALAMIEDKPVFGCGINNYDFYKYYYPVYIPGIEGYVGPTSHNTYLTILAEVGLSGFIPYVVILAILLKQWLTIYIRASGNPLVGGRELVGTIGAATICYFGTAMAIDMRFFRYTEYLLWTLLALISVQYSMLKSGAETAPVEPQVQGEFKRRYVMTRPVTDARQLTRPRRGGIS